MSDAPAKPTSAPRYRLGTFGTLALLTSANELVLGRHGHHRRRLALLAVLAAAGARGRSRDQLHALFWPEAAQPRARHSLDQLLYALRSTLDEALFASGDPVRLNGAVLASDVEAFEAALERDDLRAAVNLYRGPFLDGFHLGDSAEFERWLDAERARLERRHAGALERLAERAERADDRTGAVEWRRRLAETDPLSDRYAAGLIRALRNAGDHAAALKHAERHETLVGEELGTRAGPEVAAIVAEVRADAPSAVVVASPSPRTARRTRSRPDDGAVAPLMTDSAAHAPSSPESATRSRRRRWVTFGVASLATIVLVIVGVKAARRSPPLPTSEPAIAVLPFATIGGDRTDSVLADGIGDELSAALARISRVRVLARSSTVSLRNSGAGVRRIADSLAATHVLDGSVRRIGAQLRIQVRLMDATGAIRWSESYDRERRDVFLLHGEIAAAVARELGRSIDTASMRALREGTTQSIAAYELYLRGRDPVNFRTENDSGPRQGLAYLQQAVALDPNFAAAYANMPYMYVGLANTAPDVAHAREYKRLADSMARTAIRLDPLLPEAHTALGTTGIIGLSDLTTAEREFRRSIALGGSPRVHEHLATVLRLTGREEEALAEAMRSVKDDPLSATARAELGMTLCLNRRYDEGLAELARVAQVRPPLLRVAAYVATCDGMQGKWRDVVAQLRDRRGGRLLPMLGYALARAGDTTGARAIRDELLARWSTHQRGAFGLAVIAAGLGDLDQAFAWLDRAVDDLTLDADIMYPIFPELRADPRFDRLLARLGLQKR